MIRNHYKQSFDCELFGLIVQVLKTKVLQCDPDKAKMVLSFKAAVEGDTEEAAKPHFDCEVGKVKPQAFLSFIFTSLYLYSSIYR